MALISSAVEWRNKASRTALHRGQRSFSEPLHSGHDPHEGAVKSRGSWNTVPTSSQASATWPQSGQVIKVRDPSPSQQRHRCFLNWNDGGL